MADKPIIFLNRTDSLEADVPMIFHDRIDQTVYTDIVNPGFETGVLSPYWVMLASINSYGLTTLYPYVYTGNYALMIKDYATTGFEQKFSTARGIDAWLGQTITVSCWCLCDKANKVGLAYYCQSEYPPAQDMKFHSGSNRWEYLSMTFTVPISSTYASIRAVTIGDHAVGYFDNFSVTAPPSFEIPMKFYSRNV